MGRGRRGSAGGARAATGSRWAIAAPHAFATAAGAEAFEAGGNAVDAALAAAAVLTVVYPHMCHVGGDLFALLAHPDGRVDAINASGAAARAIDVEAVRAAGPAMPRYGPLTVDVPGVVSGWAALADRGARLGLARALGRATLVAREGVPVAPDVALSLAWDAHRLRDDPGFSRVFFPDGRALELGERLVQSALADTLERLAAGGPAALYGGDVGRRFVESLATLGSPLTLEDLAEHRAERTEPLVGAFGDVEVLVASPNSQGFVLLEMLGAIDRLGIEPDPNGPDAGTLGRMLDLACRDRDAHLADPRFADVPVERLLAPANLERIAAAARAGFPVARPAGAVHPGDTIGLVAVDADGYGVSLIQSLFDGFGAGILEPSTGMICHSRGSAFSLDPASPNVLAGGKRPAHSLMPVLVRRDGRIAVAAGTMGGWAQPQIHAQLLLRVLRGAASPAEAVAEPRWSIADTFGALDPGPRGADAGSGAPVAQLEIGVPEPASASLRAAGFRPVRMGPDEVVGHAQLIALDADGRLAAGADPRADGTAAAG